jgi:hypothetical protein
MPGLVPGIHVLAVYQQGDVDGRVKPAMTRREGLLLTVTHFSVASPASLITLAHLTVSVPMKS